MAQQIKGARFIELAGIDHMGYAGDSNAMPEEIGEFLTGKRQLPPQAGALSGP